MSAKRTSKLLIAAAFIAVVVSVISLFFGGPEIAYRVLPASVWWGKLDQGDRQLGVALCLHNPQRGILPLVQQLQKFEPSELAEREGILRSIAREKERLRAKGLPAIPPGICMSGTIYDRDMRFWPQRLLARERLMVIARTGKFALPQMVPLLEVPSVREDAAVILACAGATSVPFFEKALQSSVPEVRKTAIHGMANISFPPVPRAQELILRAMKDPDASVRLEALLNVNRSDAMGIRAVEAAVADPDPEISVTARHFLMVAKRK